MVVESILLNMIADVGSMTVLEMVCFRSLTESDT